MLLFCGLFNQMGLEIFDPATCKEVWACLPPPNNRYRLEEAGIESQRVFVRCKINDSDPIDLGAFRYRQGSFAYD